MTVLRDGRVLVVGGYRGGGPGVPAGVVGGVELFNPNTGEWTSTGALRTPRAFPSATLLPNGKVLAAGGSNFSNVIYDSAELYDPETGQWTATGTMTQPRISHTATLLSNGKVLLAAGFSGSGASTTAEIFDPESGTWAQTMQMAQARGNHAAVLLADGRTLVAGGNGGGNSGNGSAELFDGGVPVAATVSGASYADFAIAAKAIVTAFGSGLATGQAVAAALPLTTSLAGTSVTVKDSAGGSRSAPLIAVSPTQISYQIPDGTVSGPAIVTVTSGDGRISYGVVNVLSSAPAIFTVNQSGSGAAIAQDAVTFTGAPFAGAQANGQPNILVLYATGLGPDATDVEANVASGVEAAVGGQRATVLYAGRVAGFPGLNQINITLPVGIASGTHAVTVARGGVTSNAVTIAIR
jgi:uncharacterized protein (TIGR03437 family)